VYFQLQLFHVLAQERSSIVKQVKITKEPIELYKILKFEGLASSGGQAKTIINDGQVLVNGEVEKRKRKKIMSGDVIEYMSETLKILLK
tara:strand:- start:324 stop:590 length:267 start_codon:yes stop_codon:yes gene_type:complete